MRGKKHILLVDDESDFRFSASVALRKAGYDVSEAENGLMALEKIVEAHNEGKAFSLLLTDIRMPMKSGMELLDDLQRDGIELPIIAISNFPEKDLVAELRARGCSEFIEKPFGPQELVERVDTLLGGNLEDAG